MKETCAQLMKQFLQCFERLIISAMLADKHGAFYDFEKQIFLCNSKAEKNSAITGFIGLQTDQIEKLFARDQRINKVPTKHYSSLENTGLGTIPVQSGA